MEIDLIKKNKNDPETVSYSLEIYPNKEDDSQRVDLNISTSNNEHPWMPFAGMYADNPLVDEVQGFIESDRLKLDEEMSENDLHIASEK